MHPPQDIRFKPYLHSRHRRQEVARWELALPLEPPDRHPGQLRQTFDVPVFQEPRFTFRFWVLLTLGHRLSRRHTAATRMLPAGRDQTIILNWDISRIGIRSRCDTAAETGLRPHQIRCAPARSPERRRLDPSRSGESLEQAAIVHLEVRNRRAARGRTGVDGVRARVRQAVGVLPIRRGIECRSTTHASAALSAASPNREKHARV